MNKNPNRTDSQPTMILIQRIDVMISMTPMQLPLHSSRVHSSCLIPVPPMALWAWSSSHLIPRSFLFHLWPMWSKKLLTFLCQISCVHIFCRVGIISSHTNYRVLEVARKYGSTQKPTKCDGMPAFLSFGPLNEQERCTLSGVRQGLCLKSSIKATFSLMLLLFFFQISLFYSICIYIYIICCLDSLFQWTCAWNFPVAVRLLTAKDETWVADVQSLFVVFKKGRRGCVWTDNG